jgi:hypothetical protein
MKNVLLIITFLVVSSNVLSQEKYSLEISKERSIAKVIKEHLKVYETKINTDVPLTSEDLDKLIEILIKKEGFISYETNSEMNSILIFHADFVSKYSIQKMFTKCNLESYIVESIISKKYQYN